MMGGPVGRGQGIRVASIVLESLEPGAVAGDMIVPGLALPVTACLVFSSSHTPPDGNINAEDSAVEYLKQSTKQINSQDTFDRYIIADMHARLEQ